MITIALNVLNVLRLLIKYLLGNWVFTQQACLSCKHAESEDNLQVLDTK
jgi:hypothetical protein